MVDYPSYVVDYLSYVVDYMSYVVNTRVEWWIT